MRPDSSLSLALVAMVLAAPVSAQWKNSVTRDEMTRATNAYATSPTVSPTRVLSFPYASTTAWLGYGCDGETEWVFVGFTMPPNIINTQPQEGGYSTFTTRVKWDEQVDTTRMIQKFGDSFLQFDDGQRAIDHLGKASTATLELEWYSQSTVYFRFSLRGASAAIAKAQASCKK
jgi:hypothetical protein